MGIAQQVWRRGIFIAAMTAKALLSPVALGTSALVERDGRFLLVRHRYMPGWYLPGGGVARGEPPAQAVLRELKEEVGLLRCSAPEFFGLYTRKAGWATNLIAVYRIADAEIDFKPNLEIREIVFADPAAGRMHRQDAAPAILVKRLAFEHVHGITSVAIAGKEAR